MSDKQYIPALEVKDFDYQLYPGDTIKIYGKETAITGFSAQYNDALGKWETIIHTVGRGDPFERTLSDIEVLEDQPRSWEERSKSVYQSQHPAVKGGEQTFTNHSSSGWLPSMHLPDEPPAVKGAVSQDAHEKEVMMKAFDKVRDLFEKRSWIMEGRGSYPYNDDRYKEEVRYMYDEFDTLFKDTWANIESKSFEYRQQIIKQYLKENPPKGAVWLKGDYDRLYEQVKAGKRTVCYIDYNPWGRSEVYRDICTIKAETMEFSSRGHCYGSSKYSSGNERQLFIELCESCNVEWLCESPTAAGDGKEGLAFIAAVTEEGAEMWKMEYDSCRKILQELVDLKELKDAEGKTEDYFVRQPVAWVRAKRFLEKYQHINW